MEQTHRPLLKFNRFALLFLAIAVLGFADAAFLTAEHVRGSVPPCSVLDGCEFVLTSPYATIGSVPVSALGALYYAVLIVMMVAYLDTGARRVLHYAAWMTVGGLLASVYFVAVQVLVIKALCPYCLVSAATSAGLFVVAFVIMRRD